MEFKPTRRTHIAATQPAAARPQSAPPVLAPPQKKPPRQRRRVIIFIVAILIVFTSLYVVAQRFRVSGPQSPIDQSSGEKETGQVTQASPDFASLTPSNKKVTWSRLTPPNGNSFYAYTDTIQGITIRVSEQSMPDTFKADPKASLAQLAQGYSANRTITVGSTTVYIGATVKGQQSILFTQDSLLVMITSDATINDKQWTTYIASLH